MSTAWQNIDESQKAYLEELKARVRAKYPHLRPVEKPEARPLIEGSWEGSLSLKDLLNLRRAGFRLEE